MSLEDACKVAERPGFAHKGGQGSHRSFGRADEPNLLNSQVRDRYMPLYRARQLISMIDAYGDDNDEISD